MGDHLHIHYLVPAGGVDLKTGEWKPSHPKFLVPGSALSTVFRAKFRDALKETDPQLFAQVPPETWHKNWVVHCKAVGDGRTALKYLASYLYRVALSNRRIIRIRNGKVTFSYKPRKKPWKTMTLDVMSFMQRFLQHVLPKGFHKVRYFGFLHPNAKKRFNTLKEQLQAKVPDPKDSPPPQDTQQTDTSYPNKHTPQDPGVCPYCGNPLRYLGRLPRAPRGPPCEK